MTSKDYRMIAIMIAIGGFIGLGIYFRPSQEAEPVVPVQPKESNEETMQELTRMKSVLRDIEHGNEQLRKDATKDLEKLWRQSKSKEADMFYKDVRARMEKQSQESFRKAEDALFQLIVECYPDKKILERAIKDAKTLLQGEENNMHPDAGEWMQSVTSSMVGKLLSEKAKILHDEKHRAPSTSVRLVLFMIDHDLAELINAEKK